MGFTNPGGTGGESGICACVLDAVVLGVGGVGVGVAGGSVWLAWLVPWSGRVGWC